MFNSELHIQASSGNCVYLRASVRSHIFCEGVHEHEESWKDGQDNSSTLQYHVCLHWSLERFIGKRSSEGVGYHDVPFIPCSDNAEHGVALDVAYITIVYYPLPPVRHPTKYTTLSQF